MAASNSDIVVVVVLFERVDPCSINCEGWMTLSDMRAEWLAKLNASPSVSFFSSTNRYLPDNLTIREALVESGKDASEQVLQLRALPNSRIELQLFGFEELSTQLEVPGILRPSQVRRQIGDKLGIFTDNFTLYDSSFQQADDEPFNEQEGALLIADIGITVHVTLPEDNQQRSLNMFGSQTVGELRQELHIDEEVALVAKEPSRHILSDSLCLCHVADNILQLHAPIELVAEKKCLLFFEPIGLQHRRQQIPIHISSTPLDIKNTLQACFELTTDFRLSVDGAPLSDRQPLVEQIIDSDDTVIQLDLVRPFTVRDQWSDLGRGRFQEEVYLYSTESPVGLFLRDLTCNQKLRYDGIQLTIFGSVIDVFGTISGQKTPSLVIDRDVERNLPMLSFGSVERKLAWARSLLVDILPVSRGIYPKEVMCNENLVAARNSLKKLCLTGDSLITLDPVKVVVKSDKRLRIHRFPRGTTHRDLLQKMKLLQRRRDLVLKTRYSQLITGEEINAEMNLDFYLLACSSRFETKVMVSLNGESFGCWFEPDQVTFSDIMIKVGTQAKVPPRHLFSRSLFCCGCGRKICREEESIQTVPSNCCRVKSLRLTDRRIKHVGVQTAIPRAQEKETFTLYPEERDACVGTEPRFTDLSITTEVGVGTEPQQGRELTDASLHYRRVATSHPPPTPLHVIVATPEGEEEEKSLQIRGSRGRSLFAIAKELETSLGKSPFAFCEEGIYWRDEGRRSMRCLGSEGLQSFFDVEDGSFAKSDRSPADCLRVLLPSSQLPTLPNQVPLVFIKANTDLLTISGQRHVETAPDNALSDGDFVAFIRGVRQGEKLFLENQFGKFFDSESGKWCPQHKIPGTRVKRHFVLLLRDGDRVPRLADPGLGAWQVCCRQGLEPRVREGRVCIQVEKVVVDKERWRNVSYDETFHKEFVQEAMRE